MYLRLRQIALVARKLEDVEDKLTAFLGTPVCFRDAGVGKYGLHNALWALGGSFLEVVAPKPGSADTAAGRYLDRRKGDGGYMYIIDCDDLEARREHARSMGARIVEDVNRAEHGERSESIHLHPRDTGATLLSIDRHSGGEDTMGGYVWAGGAWQGDCRRDVRISGAEMECGDPQAVSERWSFLLRRGVLAKEDGVYEMAMDNAFARFTPPIDDRGEGLTTVHLAAADPAALVAAGKAAGARAGADWVDLCGVRFVVAKG
jgi:hypothetical protein